MARDADRIKAGEQIRVRVSFERQRGTLSYSVRPEWIAQSNSPDPNNPVEPPVENLPPTLVECAAPGTVQVGVLYDYTPIFQDSNGDALTYRTDFRQPPWTDFDTSTGRLYGTPSRADIGTYQYIKIFASDGTAETKCGGFRITVGNTAPEISGTPATSAAAFQTDEPKSGSSHQSSSLLKRLHALGRCDFSRTQGIDRATEVAPTAGPTAGFWMNSSPRLRTSAATA